MIRRALIIYCDNTSSGRLAGPSRDAGNYFSFLTSKLGGGWLSHEVVTLQNPRKVSVLSHINTLVADADYSFIIYSGHGYIDGNSGAQNVELLDGPMPITQLRTRAPRQTLIVDACRGIYHPGKEMLKSVRDALSHFTGDVEHTRYIFDNAVMAADEGWTVLFSASANQTSLDTNDGGAYLLSLMRAAEYWYEKDRSEMILTLSGAHDLAKVLIKDFPTVQQPTTNAEKRNRHYPFAVKLIPIHT